MPALLLLLGAFAYLRWFARQAVAAFPYCRVELVSAPGSGVTTADVTLVGAARPYRLTRITYSPESGRAPLPVPEGFEPEEGEELGADTVSWVPRRAIELGPGRSSRFSFAFDPTMPDAVRVSGWIEARVGLGGSGAFFRVPVGPLSDGERDHRNLESRVRAESVSRGIRPADHPEWAELKRREAELEGVSEPGTEP